MAKSVQVINNIENRAFFSILCYDKNIETEKTSLFERFAIFCESLRFVSGSRVGREFTEALLSDLECDLPYGIDTDREVQKAVWRRINGDKQADINIAKKGVSAALEKNCDNEKISIADLELLLKDPLENELEDFILRLSMYDEICLSLSDFIYQRPNAYHSAIAYKKLIDKEKLNLSERSMLQAWIICKILMQKNARLFLKLENDLCELKKLLDLLEDRRLSPSVGICFSNFELCDEVSELCLSSKQKNISPKIIISEEMSVDGILMFIKRLAYSLPLTRISCCEFLASKKEAERFENAFALFMQEAGGI